MLHVEIPPEFTARRLGGVFRVGIVLKYETRDSYFELISFRPADRRIGAELGFCNPGHRHE